MTNPIDNPTETKTAIATHQERFVLLDPTHVTEAQDWARLYSVYVQLPPPKPKGLAALLRGKIKDEAYELQFMLIHSDRAVFTHVPYALEQRVRLQYELSSLFGKDAFGLAILHPRLTEQDHSE